jgi:hypothetical protein
MLPKQERRRGSGSSQQMQGLHFLERRKDAVLVSGEF